MGGSRAINFVRKSKDWKEVNWNLFFFYGDSSLGTIANQPF